MGPRDEHDAVHVRVENLWFVTKTEKAFGFSLDEGGTTVEVWIPKSQARTRLINQKGWCWVEIPKWLADEKELNYAE